MPSSFHGLHGCTGNDIGPDGATALVEGLKVTTHLEKLSLHCKLTLAVRRLHGHCVQNVESNDDIIDLRVTEVHVFTSAYFCVFKTIIPVVLGDDSVACGHARRYVLMSSQHHLCWFVRIN